MQLNCKWKVKLGRYSEKVISRLDPLARKLNTPFVQAYMLQSLKFWRTTQASTMKHYADQLLSFPSLNFFDSIELLKYGLRSSQSLYTDYFLKNHENLSFMIGEDLFSEIRSCIANEKSLKSFNVLEKCMEKQWKNNALVQNLNNKDIYDCDIEKNSKYVILNMENKNVVIYGVRNKDDTLADVLELIEKNKIKNIALPFQSAKLEISYEELSEKLQEKLNDKNNYKVMDVHKLVLSNKFGVKATNLPWSLVLRKNECNYFMYCPDVEEIKLMFDDFFEVEANVRACMVLDHCRIMEEVSEKGCFLCNKHRLFPVAFQEYAIYASPFINALIKSYSDRLRSILHNSEGNLLILCPPRLMLDIITSTFNPVHSENLRYERLSEENEMLARLFYDSEKQYTPPKKLKDNYEAILESFSPISLEPWRKEKFDFMCHPIKEFFNPGDQKHTIH